MEKQAANDIALDAIIRKGTLDNDDAAQRILALLIERAALDDAGNLHVSGVSQSSIANDAGISSSGNVSMRIGTLEKAGLVKKLPPDEPGGILNYIVLPGQKFKDAEMKNEGKIIVGDKRNGCLVKRAGRRYDGSYLMPNGKMETKMFEADVNCIAQNEYERWKKRLLDSYNAKQEKKQDDREQNNKEQNREENMSESRYVYTIIDENGNLLAGGIWYSTEAEAKTIVKAGDLFCDTTGFRVIALAQQTLEMD